LNLRCVVGGHEYRYEGVMLGNRIERCQRCNKVRLTPTAKLGTVHPLRLHTDQGRPIPAPDQRRPNSP
jgi:hypothetical protein